MNLRNFFKRKPLWEKLSFPEFAKHATQNDLQKYLDTLYIGKEIDYTRSHWGHQFSANQKIGNFIHSGTGHYQNFGVTPRIQPGDIFLLKVEGGDIGKFQVLHIEYFRDPADMFAAYVACVGVKEK